MPTLHFLLYLLAVGLAYLFRLSYLGWFGPYLLAAVIFVPLLMLLLSLPAMLSMRLSMEAEPYCEQNTAASLRLRFHTRRFMPVSAVRLRLQIENLYAGELYTEKRVFRNVGSSEASISLPTALCGTLRCHVTKVECMDLLGLFSFRMSYPEALYCTVLPQAKAPDDPLNVKAALQSYARFKPKYGGGFSEEHDLREYRAGDTVNSIHWKLSSKLDDVIVREPLERENKDVFLVLARAGAGDRGLEVLNWLSRSLCALEVPHRIVADSLYDAANELETVDALRSILSVPMTEPCPYDASNARCIFVITAGEVHVI
ncbi:MAG: DUF58 domain-containing protein [Oscillospiraceae bacterium]|nr:DUF58 domain-containing protein [Oscillospiraceae bacterium]